MKTTPVLLAAATLTLALHSSLFSQAPAPIVPAPVQRPATVAAPANAAATLNALRAMRVNNARMLQQQEATSKALDELAKEAQQMKFWAKRA